MDHEQQQGKIADKLVIDRLVTKFFSIFKNTHDHQPDWETIYHTCIDEVVIIKKEKSGHIVYDMNSFITPRKKILSDGTLTEFSESEVSEQTTVIGNIAHRTSRYQKSGYLNGIHFHDHGNKFFQFVRTAEGWRISSVIWEDE